MKRTADPVSWVAPGRVNLIGEHVDYNDGLVLPIALPMTTTATVRRRGDSIVHVRSATQAEERSFPVSVQPGEVQGWAAYVAGVVWAVGSSAAGDRTGLEIDLRGDVPLGAGLSSSASLTCAVAAAVDEAWGVGLHATEIARRCRLAENDFVGAPTGPMDQLAAMLCRAGQALLLDCRDLGYEHIPLDLEAAGLRLLVVDTGVRHSLADSAYADRRAECAAAAATIGVDSLRDATMQQVRGVRDQLLQRRAFHVVSELARVRVTSDLLRAGHPEDVGAFLTASHESLRDHFEVSCPELDVAVESALLAGALGARLTGGGFGGSAIVLSRERDVPRVVERVEAAYRQQDWKAPTWWVATPSAGTHRLP